MFLRIGESSVCDPVLRKPALPLWTCSCWHFHHGPPPSQRATRADISASRFNLELTGKWGASKFDPPSSLSCNYAFWNWGAGKVSEVKRGLNTPDKSACVHAENSLLPFLQQPKRSMYSCLKEKEGRKMNDPCGWLCLFVSAIMWYLRGWGGVSVVTYGERRHRK